MKITICGGTEEGQLVTIEVAGDIGDTPSEVANAYLEVLEIVDE